MPNNIVCPNLGFSSCLNVDMEPKVLEILIFFPYFYFSSLGLMSLICRAARHLQKDVL